MSEFHSVDAERRFGGLARLYGAESLRRFAGAHIAVAGLGGVGSWCAEALARSGIGRLTLIDLDHISESNVNRQLHALTQTLGCSKVQAMRDRVAAINPDCVIHAVDDFVTPDNAGELLGSGLTLLIDCTDQISAKVAMILESARHGVPIVVCGGAGGKTRLQSLSSGDLSRAANDALLAKLRNTLRRRHGYPKASDQAGKVRRRVPRMGVRALWFDQKSLLPEEWLAAARPAAEPGSGSGSGSESGSGSGSGSGSALAPGLSGEPARERLQGLSCAGYGSAVTITATMGMAAAAEAIDWLLAGRFPA